MKKMAALLLAFALIVPILGCSSGTTTSKKTEVKTTTTDGEKKTEVKTEEKK